MISAIKMANKELSGFEVCDVHHDHSLENDLRVLFTTNTRYKATIRSKIKQLLMYIDAETAYLVDVVAVGPGFPDSLIKIPAGFTTPQLWEKQERNSWLALEGEFERVNPADYRLDSNPEKALPQTFTSGQSSHAYVHKA